MLVDGANCEGTVREREDSHLQMNKVEIVTTFHQEPKWMKFANLLSLAMTELGLDGVTVVLRELTAEEKGNEEKDVLEYNHESQTIEFAIGTHDSFPAASRLAERIREFLEPEIEVG